MAQSPRGLSQIDFTGLWDAKNSITGQLAITMPGAASPPQSTFTATREAAPAK
jgi:hypothetical protein